MSKPKRIYKSQKKRLNLTIKKFCDKNNPKEKEEITFL